MRILILFALLMTASFAVAPAARAASENDFKAAYAAAEATNREAETLRNQWTVTADALKQAQKAASSGNYDEAVRLAKQAEALARASVAQAKEQAEAWKAAVIH
jgi:hypothetical protein